MLHFRDIYRNSCVAISLDEVCSCLQVTWLGQPTSHDYRHNVRQVTALLLEKNLHRALFDIRKRIYVEISDQNWLLREIIPLFSKHQVRFAYLTSVEGLALMDTLRVREAVAQAPDLASKLEIELFIEEDDARLWLMEGESIPFK